MKKISNNTVLAIAVIVTLACAFISFINIIGLEDPFGTDLRQTLLELFTPILGFCIAYIGMKIAVRLRENNHNPVLAIAVGVALAGAIISYIEIIGQKDPFGTDLRQTLLVLSAPLLAFCLAYIVMKTVVRLKKNDYKKLFDNPVLVTAVVVALAGAINSYMNIVGLKDPFGTDLRQTLLELFTPILGFCIAYIGMKIVMRFKRNN